MVICEVCIRGGGRLTGRTGNLLGGVGGLLLVGSIASIHIVGECSIRGVRGSLFSCTMGAMFSRPRLSGTATSFSTGNNGIFTIRFLPNRFSRHTSSTTRYVRLVSRNRHPEIGATGMCVVSNGISSSRVTRVGGCIVGPIRTHLTSLRLPRALRAGCSVPAAIGALSKFVGLSRDNLTRFIGDCNLTVSGSSVTFYRGCFGSRGHGPAVARVHVVSAC